MLDARLIGDRYRLLDMVGEGGMGTVYRALDRLTGAYVALKQVALARREGQSEGASAILRYALAQEFKVLASLRHPHIISVLDYGFDAEPYFTLELLENAQPFGEYAAALPLTRQVELAIQLLQALAYLHQRGVLHRDLKPGNVMIADDHVKVLDFGLAVTYAQFNPEEGMVGTLAYIAPEIVGYAPPSVASDLYAVGVMLYQMLVGRVPFTAQPDKYQIMLDILNTIPDYTPIADNPITPVIMRLLLKDPVDRYATAAEVIAALCDALDMPRPVETTAVRESYLVAAEFVGREAEFDQLRAALDHALGGQGSAWLIGGESGVGKSRLLDELRTHALIAGALVLRGQAVAEAGTPYQIWRSPIRRLILHVEISDFAAAVLKPLVPDIDRLIGRAVGDSPEIDSQSLQLRLLGVIEALFRASTRPILLLLEDVQWADDSLVLLKRLNELARSKPLLIVGSYRSDERPTLPAEYPALHHLTLGRLSDASIEQLSASMLGDAGRSQAVIDLLKREAEGNAFFMVEVVRALAADSAQLADIGAKPLPERVFAGGMHALITRRLDQVAPSAQSALTLAAFSGRQLDLDLLRCLLPTLNLDDWFLQVASVIEVRSNRFRFAHDKLRDAVIERVPPDERRALHRQIAGAIESLYPDAPDQFAALAYHWGEAGDAAKTIRYAIRAGEDALHAGAYRDAIRLFEQAHALIDAAPLERIRLTHLIGAAYWGQTDMVKAQQWHSKALALIGLPVPESNWRLSLATVKPVFQHLAARLTRRPPRSAEPGRWQLAAESLNELTKITYYNANLNLGLFCLFNGMLAAERAGDTPRAIHLQTSAYHMFGFALGDVGLHRLAGDYLRLSAERLRRAPDLETETWRAMVEGIYRSGRGQWEIANRVLSDAMHMSLQTGSQRVYLDACEYRMYALYLQSRYAEARALVEEAAPITVRDELVQTLGRFRIARARILLHEGDLAEARAEYYDHEAEIAAALSLGAQTPYRITALAFLVELHSRIGAWEEARAAAAALDQVVNGAQTLSMVLAGAAAASIPVYLTLWERQHAPDMDRLVGARLALYHRKYTRPHDIGAAVEGVYRCWYHWLRGDEPNARKAGAAAIRAAQTFKMPYYEGLAHYHLGRFMPERDPARAHHLDTALHLFDSVGATFEANRIRFAE